MNKEKIKQYIKNLREESIQKIPVVTALDMAEILEAILEEEK